MSGRRFLLFEGSLQWSCPQVKLGDDQVVLEEALFPYHSTNDGQ